MATVPATASQSAKGPTNKGYRGLGMEGPIARWYAATTHKSFSEYQALARRVAAEITADAAVLEVAPGPGYFAIELAKLGGRRVAGLDISQTFVDIAKKNAQEAGVDVDFRLGNVATMPFGNDSFDFLLCRAAFKNFSEPLQALQEMHRVLKPGGRALIIDLRRDASWDSIRQEVDKMRLGFVNALITRLTFRFVLLKRAYTKSEFQNLISQTKFRSSHIEKGPIGLDVDLRK